MHAVSGSSIPGSEGGSSESSPKPGDLIADRYQIERFIGRGGMAEVFAGLNVRTGKRVALKWIRPALATTSEALARFRREAVAAGRIHHPNVVTVFDVVEHKSATWLVMELLEGDTLSEILNRVERMDPEDAFMLLIPAMRGVAAAHAHGVVHRDIKPDNIFICRAADGQRREAKVLDFGVSKLSDESGDQVSITVTGNLVGTPTYMAPEQVRGNKTVDPRSDVYSLGVVLYQMLAGRPPFQGQVYSALMIEIATTDAPRLRTLRPDISEEIESIVHKAIARDLDHRYPDVTTFVHALEALVRSEPGYAPHRIVPTPSARIELPAAAKDDTLTLTNQRLRRIRITAIAAASVVVLGVIIKILVSSSSSRTLRSLEARSAQLAGATHAAAPAASAPVGPGPAARVAAPVAGNPRTEGGPAAVPVGDPAAAGQTAQLNERRSSGSPPRSHGRGKSTAAKEDKAVEGPPVTPRESRPAPTSGPATRAGRLTIDDF
jgi:serine/threonine-protein kinase